MFYFVLGVLSVLALFLIGVLIYGMVKVSKLTKSSKNFEQLLHHEVEQIHRRMGEDRREIYNDFDRFRNDISQNFKDVYSYTDSRIDKSLDKKK